jgi:hypothetical protein
LWLFNKLPDQVINAPSTNTFKNRIEYWENEEIYYSDYKAEISGGNIQLQEIDTIEEFGEVAPREVSSGNHR